MGTESEVEAEGWVAGGRVSVVGHRNGREVGNSLGFLGASGDRIGEGLTSVV